MKYKLIAFSGGVLCKLRGETNFWDFVRKQHEIPNLKHLYEEGKITREELLGEYKYWRKKRLTKNKLDSEVAKHLILTKGTKKLFTKLNSSGAATCIISGSSDILVKRLAKRLKPKYVSYNEILFDEKGLPYSTKPTHPTADIRMDKVAALKDFARREDLQLQNCAVVGRRREETDLFRAAGFSIAFNPADDEIRKAASVVVASNDIYSLLKFLKFDKSHRG